MGSSGTSGDGGAPKLQVRHRSTPLECKYALPPGVYFWPCPVISRRWDTVRYGSSSGQGGEAGVVLFELGADPDHRHIRKHFQYLT